MLVSFEWVPSRGQRGHLTLRDPRGPFDDQRPKRAFDAQRPKRAFDPQGPWILHIVLYCIVSINLYSASCSAHQSEALPVRETQREESSLERTKRRTWHTS